MEIEQFEIDRKKYQTKSNSQNEMIEVYEQIEHDGAFVFCGKFQLIDEYDQFNLKWVKGNILNQLMRFIELDKE